MEEYRDDRQRRREVWFDENLVPGSTAANIALEVTGADEDMVQSWVDFVMPHEGEWLTYGQWVEGELSVSLEQGRGVMMSPNDWDQHFQWISRMWNELAKVTEEHHDQDGASATEVEMRNRRRSAELERAVEAAKEPTIGVRVPGQLICRLHRDDRSEFHVAGWTFSPSAGAGGYRGPSAHMLIDLDLPGEGEDEELHALADSLKFGDVSGPFWVAVQKQLNTIRETSGEDAIVVEWVE